jgi:prepilin-type N-terminal cleavage/methylation domain-containing protein
MQLDSPPMLCTLANYGARTRRKSAGFSLVELAIVLVIVGLLLGGILNGRTVIRSAQIQDRIKSLNEMTAAAKQFKDRYGMWPGDYSNAVANIAGLTCVNGNGNGQVGTVAESACASESLIRSGLLRGSAIAPITVRGSTYSITSPALSGVVGLPGSWVNVVNISNLDCDSAVQMDRAVDDGVLTTGSFQASPAALCGATNDVQDENILVANVVYRIN